MISKYTKPLLDKMQLEAEVCSSFVKGFAYLNVFR